MSRCAVAFRKKRYERSGALQIDLDNVMNSYNYRRTHQGYNLKKNGFRKPAEAHLSETLTFIEGLLAYNWNQSEAKRRWKKNCLLLRILLKQRTKILLKQRTKLTRSQSVNL